MNHEWQAMLLTQLHQHFRNMADNDNDYLRGRVSADPLEDVRFVREYARRVKQGDFPLMSAAERRDTLDFLRAYEHWIVYSFVTPDAKAAEQHLRIVAQHHPEWFHRAPDAVKKMVFEHAGESA